MSVSNVKTVQYSGVISRFENGLVSFTQFALVQFLLGCQLAEHYRAAYNHKEDVPANVFMLLGLVSTLLMEITAKQMERNEPIFMTRQELVILKSWLEARMFHCEKQRDERIETFNPDTYIGQKLLLLDLRELLIGELIEC